MATEQSIYKKKKKIKKIQGVSLIVKKVNKVLSSFVSPSHLAQHYVISSI